MQQSTCRYGSGVHVGTTELMGSPSSGGARILTEHSAFNNVGSVQYLNPPATCTDTDDCVALCGPLFDPIDRCRCVNGTCVGEHASKVASRIAASNTCLDPSQLTSASFSTMDAAGGIFSVISDQLEATAPPDTPAKLCEPGEFMASQVDLYIANNLTPGGAVPSVEELKDQYDWFVTNDVFIVNESWGITNAHYSNWAVLADYYSRKHGITFTQASGNLTAGRSQQPTFCQGFNPICVGAIRPRSGTPNQAVWREGTTSMLGGAWELGQSQMDNQNRIVVFTPFDLTTKPDIVSSAELVDVAGFYRGPLGTRTNDSPSISVPTSVGVQDVDLWTQDSGTSFAAPTVAAAVALHAENCGGIPPPPHVVKGRLKTGSMLNAYLDWETASSQVTSGTWQPICPAGTTPDTDYPHLTDACDYRAGAGGLLLGGLRSRGGDYPACPVTSICGGGGGGGGTPTSFICAPEAESPGSLSSTEQLVLCGGTTTENEFEFENDDDFDIPSSDLPAGTPGKNGRKGKRTSGPFNGANGFFIRSTLSYYSCPPESPEDIVERIINTGANEDLATSRSDLTVAVDFDLILVGRNSPSDPWTLLDVSSSPEEVAEGFHLESSVGYSTVEVWATAPTNFVPCDSAYNPPGVLGEPVANNTIFYAYP